MANIVGTEDADVLGGLPNESNTIHGLGGNDVLSGSGLSDFLFGGADNDTLIGNGGDSLFGEAGNDTLIGNAGADFMAGGTGDDIYHVRDPDASVIEDPSNGSDHVTSYVNFILTPHVERLTLREDSLATTGTGNGLDNQIFGNSLNNTLSGEGGDDLLVGVSGDDTLVGGLGSDFMSGGTGNDTYYIDNAGDVAAEDPGGGVDTVRSSISYALSVTPNLENLVLIPGAGAIMGLGNAFANWIIGNESNNTLEGFQGADTLDGGIGEDTANYSNSDASVTVNLATGSGAGGHASGDLLLNIERVFGSFFDDALIGNASANFLSGNAGNDTLDGGAGIDTLLGGTGNDSINGGDGADELNGDDGDDSLTGGQGNDLLEGEFGNDILNGGDGNDTLVGHADNDTLSGGEGADALDGGLGNDTMQGGQGHDAYLVDSLGDSVTETAGLGAGIDVVHTTINYTLPVNVEALVLDGFGNIDGTGNSADNTITGNSGNNIIDGGVGADVMQGGGSGDIYFVANIGDIVLENAGEGTDTVIASISYTVPVNVELLVLAGAAHLAGTGNASDNVITGNSGNNSLNGSVGNDVLSGNEGNDRLDGGFGIDTTLGDLGDDVHVINSLSDIVLENADEGTDTLEVAFTYSGRPVNFEIVQLGGNAAIDLTGSIGADILRGNNATNTIIGGVGADVIVGQGGKDLMTGGAGLDRMVLESLSDSGVTFGARDVINTFAHGDKIDVSAIDAKTTVAGDQAFVFVAAFTGVAGQLQWDLTNVSVTGVKGYLVQGDVNGDSQADFSLQVYTAPTQSLPGGPDAWNLAAFDFIL